MNPTLIGRNYAGPQLKKRSAYQIPSNGIVFSNAISPLLDAILISWMARFTAEKEPKSRLWSFLANIVQFFTFSAESPVILFPEESHTNGLSIIKCSEIKEEDLAGKRLFLREPVEVSVKILDIGGTKEIKEKHPEMHISDGIGSMLASLGKVPYLQQASNAAKTEFLKCYLNKL
ncbi:nuclear mRNA export protein Sac3 [Mitosporidium daphniae]|uniref:Nuclear mRNA export protein Sac3 n=1 Tax=Mitosporidium daphniae TaxID=1485682 RepID=A0A098VR93_9MICR|nr:nuclear mRNA export protein Sac3 [Mitosporidium daphniae]KGG51568.1 nuclear mRNA export protein Sac3 [Mitosporidium daphniae]|eukprot:XP_013237995.1 nuclear mRNA export protein Sac3 [Mitosporidium daphniae]